MQEQNLSYRRNWSSTPFYQPKFHPNRDKSKQHQRPLFSIGSNGIWITIWNQSYLTKISPSFFIIDLIISCSIGSYSTHQIFLGFVIAASFSWNNPWRIVLSDGGRNSGNTRTLSNFYYRIRNKFKWSFPIDNQIRTTVFRRKFISTSSWCARKTKTRV